ncbi:MAG: C4-dicarboxylate ABC transporter permease [Kordiimonadales bacterium]|nr:MAG: C4-dicarboxylate ABC transporter permease [Kordiimonadales bacterium]
MLYRLSEKIEALLEASGQILAFLPLILILVQFTVVLMVYVFASGSIQLQESLQYINAMMFLGGAGYAAVRDEHVRVDIFYSTFSKTSKARVDFYGTLFLLVPFLILFWITTVPYVAQSWRELEASVETSGLPYVYILKTTLILFALTLTLHAISALIRSFAAMRKE